MTMQEYLPTRTAVLDVPHPGHPDSGRCGRCSLAGAQYRRNGWIYCDADCAAPYTVPAKDCCGTLTGDLCECATFALQIGGGAYGGRPSRG